MAGMLLLTMSMVFLSCEKEEKDEFYERDITASELEAGYGTFSKVEGSKTHYLKFKDGILTISVFQGNKCESAVTWNYSVNGDELYLYNANTIMGTKTYSLKIEWIHWGKGRGEQLMVVARDGGSVPSGLAEGYYDKY